MLNSIEFQLVNAEHALPYVRPMLVNATAKRLCCVSMVAAPIVNEFICRTYYRIAKRVGLQWLLPVLRELIAG